MVLYTTHLCLVFLHSALSFLILSFLYIAVQWLVVFLSSLLLCDASMQGDGDQERLKRQQELTSVNLYQYQQLQYQYLLRYSHSTGFSGTAALHPTVTPLTLPFKHLFTLGVVNLLH